MPLRGDRLRDMRHKRGMSQDELAERIKTTRQQIGRYEKGKSEPTAHVLSGLADTLVCSSDYLLGRVDSPTEHTSEIDPKALALAVRIMQFPEHTRNALIGIIESMEKSRNKQ
jgi:transcriptional regulator with XRE-family HTH domain